ncbi:DinB family protein [uncultured Polaribacter sp.]|uniref:DinB family protein n=1 Tax=uncultured Polaribacter sp. TaxID=174711 RepID=UPI0026290720|nr:DinB family protein [uncultured Polaribacter sp.]
MIPKNEYDSYFDQYLQFVLNKNTSIIDNLESSQKQFQLLLRNLPEEKQHFSYGEGKWTLKELIQHIIDTERIFSYRALCFARNDKTVQPGFDQDTFVNNTKSNDRDFNDLLNELALLRKGTIMLFKSFTDEDLLRVGVASEKKISVRALGYLFSGHQMHHLNVIQERYL